jgi:hypothetical protein
MISTSQGWHRCKKMLRSNDGCNLRDGIQVTLCTDVTRLNTIYKIQKKAFLKLELFINKAIKYRIVTQNFYIYLNKWERTENAAHRRKKFS